MSNLEAAISNIGLTKDHFVLEVGKKSFFKTPHVSKTPIFPMFTQSEVGKFLSLLNRTNTKQILFRNNLGISPITEQHIIKDIIENSRGLELKTEHQIFFLQLNLLDRIYFFPVDREKSPFGIIYLREDRLCFSLEARIFGADGSSLVQYMVFEFIYE